MRWWKKLFYMKVLLLQTYCLQLRIVFQNLQHCSNANKAMMKLQHIHYCWKPIADIYPFYRMTPNSHQNLDMIMIERFIGINPMILCDTLDNNKINNAS